MFKMSLLEIFYRALTISSIDMEDTIYGGYLMRLRWETALEMLYKISLINWGWENWEVESGSDIYAIGASCNQKVDDDSIKREIALLRTDLGLVTKQFLAASSEKVNIIGSHILASKVYELELKEKANNLDRQLAGFWAKEKRNLGWTTMNDT